MSHSRLITDAKGMVEKNSFGFFAINYVEEVLVTDLEKERRKAKAI